MHFCFNCLQVGLSLVSHGPKPELLTLTYARRGSNPSEPNNSGFPVKTFSFMRDSPATDTKKSVGKGTAQRLQWKRRMVRWDPEGRKVRGESGTGRGINSFHS